MLTIAMYRHNNIVYSMQVNKQQQAQPHSNYQPKVTFCVCTVRYLNQVVWDVIMAVFPFQSKIMMTKQQTKPQLF